MAKLIKCLIKSKSFPQLNQSIGLLLLASLILQLQVSLTLGQTEPPLTPSNVGPTSSMSSSVSETSRGDAATDSTQSLSVAPPTATVLPDETLPSDTSDDGNVGVAIAAAEAKRTTTVKKELEPTTEPTTSTGLDQTSTSATSETGGDQLEQQARQQTNERPLERLLPSVQSIQQQQQQNTELGSLSPGLTSAIGDIAERLPGVYNRDQLNSSQLSSAVESAREDAELQRLLPTNTNLFNKEAVDATQMGEMDCHLRNLDFCLAGLLGTAQKIMPETNQELDTRCDEMKVTASCMAVYNKRCGTFKLFSIMAPFTQQSSQLLSPGSNLLTEPQKDLLASSTARISDNIGQTMSNSDANSKLAPFKPSFNGLAQICEPHAKNSVETQQIRQRLFQLAKCINARIPSLSPCLEDLKTALQMFYEPRRVLPMRPTCCALARLRACSMQALDGVCGLSSFETLMSQFANQMGASNGPVGMLGAIERICRQGTDHKSSYCREVLPPSGMKMPPRRGNKASKLAKALELISFAPATQNLGAVF